MIRALSALALLTALSACKQPTEIVVRLDTPSGNPPQITVKLHRSIPFSSDPQTPSFVVAALDGADLDLLVTPQGQETAISLLPQDSGPKDLTIEASAPDFKTDPDGPQMFTFMDNASVEARFTLTPLPMPMPDLAMARDAAVSDGATGD